MTRVAADSCEISYETAGSGAPLVLIHGLGGSKVIWRDVRDRLEPRFRVIAYDLRGAGETRETARQALSLDVWSSDLRGLLEHLGVKRPVLVGHSLGASIALKYALRWPDDVEALVLMGADARLSRLEPRMRQTIELVRRLGIAGWVESHWSKNPPFSEESIERSPEMLERYRAMVIANSAENYVRTCLAIASCEDLSGALGEITQPALVVVGGKDDRTLPEDGRRIAARMPRVTLFEVPTAGHSLPLEAPDEIAAAISRFLDGVGMGGETA